jgi:hypothetical protein
VKVPTSVNVAPSRVGSAVVIKLGFGAGDEPTANDGITNRPDVPPVVPITGVAEKGIQNPGLAHVTEVPSASMIDRARMRRRFFMFDPVPARFAEVRCARAIVRYGGSTVIAERTVHRNTDGIACAHATDGRGKRGESPAGSSSFIRASTLLSVDLTISMGYSRQFTWF